MVQIMIAFLSGLEGLPEELIEYQSYIVMGVIIMVVFCFQFVLRLFGLLAGIIGD